MNIVGSDFETYDALIKEHGLEEILNRTNSELEILKSQKLENKISEDSTISENKIDT
jgi:hypothetical protein